MRNVLILAALTQELASVARSTGAVEVGQVAGSRLLHGRLGSIDVHLTLTGVGKVNAAVTAALGMTATGADTVICLGVGGALDPTLRVGDVVVGTRTIHHDAGVLRDDGLQTYQAGHVPFFNPTDRLGYAPSESLLALARAATSSVSLSPIAGVDPSIRFGVIVTGDQFLDGPVTRDRLHATLDALIVEMEGAAVAQTADRLGVDHLVVRAASDLAGGGGSSTFDFNRFLDQVAENSARVALGILAGLSAAGGG